MGYVFESKFGPVPMGNANQTKNIVALGCKCVPQYLHIYIYIYIDIDRYNSGLWFQLLFIFTSTCGGNDFFCEQKRLRWFG